MIAEAQSHASDSARAEAANHLEVTEALGLVLGEDTRSLSAWRDAALETGRSWTDVVLEQLVTRSHASRSACDAFGVSSLPADLNPEEKRAITSAIYRLAVIFVRINRRHQDFDFDGALRFVTFCVDQVGRKISEGGEMALLKAVEVAEIPDSAPPDHAMHGTAASREPNPIFALA